MTSGHFGSVISPVKDDEESKRTVQKKESALVSDAFMNINNMIPFNDDEEEEKQSVSTNVTTKPVEPEKKEPDLLQELMDEAEEQEMPKQNENLIDIPA